MFPLAIGLLSAIVLIALGVWAYRRFFRKATGLEDRYAPQRVLKVEQVAMLDYLQSTFPGQVVLANVRLQDMLSVRRAADPARAMNRLGDQQVDYAVCDNEGRPVFAFDVEQYHLSNAKAKTHQVKLKNRALKTAGVRFVFLKNSIHRMPSPAEFRQQLRLASLPQPRQSESETSDSAHQQLEKRMSQYDTQMFPSTGFRESEVMGLSGLMGLGEEKADRKNQREKRRA
jgi:hypothetical protein